MRILLIGEYSNVHTTLAQALKELGHEVLLVSDGDYWKNYPRDIDVKRRFKGIWGTIDLHLRWLLYLPKMRGFDVVHLINPHFTDMAPSWDIRITNYLAKHNRHMTLGLYGDDYIVMKGQGEGKLEYSDTWAYGKDINTDSEAARIHEWVVDCKEICEQCVNRSELLIAGLYEYYHLYDAALNQENKAKLKYVNFPIYPKTDQQAHNAETQEDSRKKKIKILIGVNGKRIKAKGTDQMLTLFERLQSEHPEDVELSKAESVPFREYQKMIAEADVIVDQLYSYTPAMNALESMSHGKVVVSGGEEEYYDFIGEKRLRPIINLTPFHDDENYRILESTILNPELLSKMKREAREFTTKYHDAHKVAQEYLNLWNKLN